MLSIVLVITSYNLLSQFQSPPQLNIQGLLTVVMDGQVGEQKELKIHEEAVKKTKYLRYG